MNAKYESLIQLLPPGIHDIGDATVALSLPLGGNSHGYVTCLLSFDHVLKDM